MNRIIQGRHIAIIGGSGSGKTRLAEKLCAKLGRRAVRLSLDDFYRDLSALAPAVREQVNFDDPAAIDWQAVRLVMKQLAQGEPAQVPVYDFATHTRRRRSRKVAPRPLIIWDGLWLLHHAPLRRQFACSVFVGCDAVTRFRRRCARDARERGRSPASIQRQFRRQVQPMHARYVEPQKKHARHALISPIAARQVAWLASELLQICDQAVASRRTTHDRG